MSCVSAAIVAGALISPAQATADPAGPEVAPSGAASLQKVQWLTDRRVALWINSPSMGVPIQVQLLLARDWKAHPEMRFPALFMLDGLRATDTENGWTHDAHADVFYADKNVNVVLPVGGESSFYSDWLESDKGHNYQWETFLTKELPPILESQWRTTNVRGIEGLSMGGTAAMFLTERNPGFATYAASYSGFLTTTTLGMPQAIQYAMVDAGGFDSHKMWGAPPNGGWSDHDPYVQAEHLRGVSLYVSAGSGTTGAADTPGEIPGISTNISGTGLEVLSRLTTENFVAKLGKLSIPVQVAYRSSGTHSWPYWDFEMRQSWPQAAAALGIAADKPPCGAGGAIGPVAQATAWLADCITGEYPVAGGIGQDFRGGQMFYSPTAGAHPVGGLIGSTYQGSGGPGGPMGLPVSNESPTPDGHGRFQSFEHGFMYWTPELGAHEVHGVIADQYRAAGFERGPLGYPTGNEVATPRTGGAVQGFQHGAVYFSPKVGAHVVGGTILGKYSTMGFEDSWLGFPTSNEWTSKDNGRYQRYEGGNVYWSPTTNGAWPVRNGPLMDAWAGQGYENGRLGYPMSDEFPIPGGVQQNFQGGNITLANGVAAIH